MMDQETGMDQGAKPQGETAGGEKQLVYSIKMSDRCNKEYRKLTKKNPILRGWIEAYIDELRTRPYLGEKLYANFPGCRSIHFRGNSYRIVYKVVDEPEPEILILDIGHRDAIYCELARLLGQGK